LNDRRNTARSRLQPPEAKYSNDVGNKAELKRCLTRAVLVLDDLSCLPLGKTGDDLLISIISQRFELRALDDHD
jgi:DNA replication protein DnaC